MDIELPEWHELQEQLGGSVWVAVSDVAPYAAGRGSSFGGKLTLRHQRSWDCSLEVETRREPGPPSEQDQHLLRMWALYAPDLAVRVENLPLTLRVDRWVDEVTVDGVVVAFVFVGTADLWCASAAVDGREAFLTGRGWDPDGLALVSASLHEDR